MIASNLSKLCWTDVSTTKFEVEGKDTDPNAGSFDDPVKMGLSKYPTIGGVIWADCMRLTIVAADNALPCPNSFNPDELNASGLSQIPHTTQDPGLIKRMWDSKWINRNIFRRFHIRSQQLKEFSELGSWHTTSVD